jgi:uncharacterized membrane protein
MAIALLALIGFFDATFLAIERLIPSPMLCPTGGGCETVAASVYAVLFGILPVALLGVAGYMAIFSVAMLAIYREELIGIPLAPVLVILTAFGAGFSAYLVYLQLAVIGAICFWCMLSAAIQGTIFLIALYNWRTYRTAGVDSSRSLAL